MIVIKNTQNPAIIKFEFPDFIGAGQNFEFKNIDEAKESPLAQKLFYLPFVKTVYISGNFIAIERYSIVEWEDVQEDVKEQIETFIADGGKILSETATNQSKTAITVYAESTPNPSVMKYVANKALTVKAAEFKNIDEASPSPLSIELFKFPFVKEVFIDENYVSIQKYDFADWQEISQELRIFIREFIEKGGVVIDESKIKQTPKHEQQEIKNFDKLDTTSQEIINILEEYVKPAVQSDGGNILFDSYDPIDKRVKVILQGACSGCPSSTFTLKNGIENMLKDMLKDNDIKVEAINM
uniref:NifU family protein n=1 Tax=Flavobacterium sp. TaxID=239 RepID=UPI00404987B6